jgi:GT2 family glycosyltransferase/glycosyltransferase involved in cell wall biosynthesis
MSRTADQLPSVSVVIVNLDGRALLSDCLDALSAQDYPDDLTEIILVDNGSSDDSVPFVRERYPGVRIIEAGRNLGFAGGSNLGVRAARGKYVALINNDARAAEDWLSVLAGALDRRPDYACACAKILTQDGSGIDFVGVALNLYGRAFQVDQGLPATAVPSDEPRDVLAPCGGAMMMRKDIFEEVGGFDEDYVAYYEDVDLGWRLWLYGYKVVYVPEAVVYHRGQQTGGRFPVEQRYALSETNALRTIIKNYEDDNLCRVLPLSLFLGVERALDQADLDRAEYELGHPRPDDPLRGTLEPEPRMTRVATSYLVAIDRVAQEMPRLMEKRKAIQAARKRSDEEVFSRFPMRPDNPLFPWRQHQVLQEQLVDVLEVPEVLRPRRGSRLLIVTHEAVGPRMAGPGVRAWEMACALSDRFEVILAAPGEPARSHPNLRVVGYDASDRSYAGLRPSVDCADVVLAMGTLFSRIPSLRDLSKPAIVDLYGPFELEKLSQTSLLGEHESLRPDLYSVTQLQLEGAIGDFFICASERQRDLWLGMLMAAGRVNSVTYAQDPTLRALIDVVPFGVPADPPRKQRAVLKGVHPGIEPRDKVLLWNGGIWPWLAPQLLIDALVQVLEVRDDVKLVFAAGQHFDTSLVPEMPTYRQTVDYCRELGLLDEHVFFLDWIPYDERGDYLLEADAAISVHRPTVESRFASRTRLLDCIWAGLPAIATGGDAVSGLIAERGLGRIVESDSAQELAQAIVETLADDQLRSRVSKAAEPLRRRLAWGSAVEPIAGFLERAALAPDVLSAARRAANARRTAKRIRSLERHVHALEEHVEAVYKGRVMRLVRAVNTFLGREQ